MTACVSKGPGITLILLIRSSSPTPPSTPLLTPSAFSSPVAGFCLPCPSLAVDGVLHYRGLWLAGMTWVVAGSRGSAGVSDPLRRVIERERR
jgi:hypothetical protein